MSTAHDTQVLETEPSGSRHPLHIAHLVMGLAFVSVAAVWLLAEVGNVPTGDLRWLVPLPFLIAGGLGLLALLLVGRRGKK